MGRCGRAEPTAYFVPNVLVQCTVTVQGSFVHSVREVQIFDSRSVTCGQTDRRTTGTERGEDRNSKNIEYDVNQRSL